MNYETRRKLREVGWMWLFVLTGVMLAALIVTLIFALPDWLAVTVTIISAAAVITWAAWSNA
jgi:hypothetical protein